MIGGLRGPGALPEEGRRLRAGRRGQRVEQALGLGRDDEPSAVLLAEEALALGDGHAITVTLVEVKLGAERVREMKRAKARGGKLGGGPPPFGYIGVRLLVAAPSGGAGAP